MEIRRVHKNYINPKNGFVLLTTNFFMRLSLIIPVFRQIISPKAIDGSILIKGLLSDSDFSDYLQGLLLLSLELNSSRHLAWPDVFIF
jgi:hypothetical protein